MVDDVEQAERAGLRRARVVTASAIFFVASMGFSQDGPRTVEHVHLAAWICWATVLVIILAGGGGWMQRPGVRALMNDDVTRENRQRSIVVGFWVALATAALAYVIDWYEPFAAQEVSRLVITFGIAAALIWFGKLERRAYRNG